MVKYHTFWIDVNKVCESTFLPYDKTVKIKNPLPSIRYTFQESIHVRILDWRETILVGLGHMCNVATTLPRLNRAILVDHHSSLQVAVRDTLPLIKPVWLCPPLSTQGAPSNFDRLKILERCLIWSSSNHTSLQVVKRSIERTLTALIGNKSGRFSTIYRQENHSIFPNQFGLARE